MKTTLEQVYENTDYFWLWCDIDGQGNQWRICRIEKINKDELMIEFFGQDFDDYIDIYMENPCLPILTPPNHKE